MSVQKAIVRAMDRLRHFVVADAEALIAHPLVAFIAQDTLDERQDGARRIWAQAILLICTLLPAIHADGGV